MADGVAANTTRTSTAEEAVPVERANPTVIQTIITLFRVSIPQETGLDCRLFSIRSMAINTV